MYSREIRSARRPARGEWTRKNCNFQSHFNNMLGIPPGVSTPHHRRSVMSWDHGTYGWEAYENFVFALKVAGTPVVEERKEEAYVRGSDLNCGGCNGYCNWDILAEKFDGELCACCRGTCDHKQNLRIGRFASLNGQRMVVEEYLAVDDRDCDGGSIVAISVYEEGLRPNLVAQVIFPR